MKQIFSFVVIATILSSCVMQVPTTGGGQYPPQPTGGVGYPTYQQGPPPQTSICGNTVDLSGVPFEALEGGQVVAVQKYSDTTIKVRIVTGGETSNLNYYGVCIFRDITYTYRPNKAKVGGGDWLCSSNIRQEGNPCVTPFQ